MLKSFLIYIAGMVICGGVLYLLYKLFIERNTSYGIARAYLTGSLIISAVIPALNIPVYPGEVVIMPGIAGEITGRITAMAADGTGTANIIPAILVFIYIAAALSGLAVIIWQVIKIKKYRDDALIEHNPLYDVIESPKITSPFSFFKNIFLSPGLERKDREQIISHEASHIKHHHSAELLFVEILKCLLWFNPFVWFTRKALSEVHEYQADREVIEAGYDIDNYKKLIFRQLLGCNPDIANGLSSPLIKKRFIMMSRNKPGRKTSIRLLAAIPVTAGLMMMFSFTRQETVYIETDPAAHEITETIVSENHVWVTTERNDVSQNKDNPEEPKKEFREKMSVKLTGDGTGNPLIIIDGEKQKDSEALNSLSEDKINHISVLKKKSDIEVYGEEGKNGVIIVTTKEYATKHDDGNPGTQEKTFYAIKKTDGEKSTVTVSAVDGEEKDKPFLEVEEMPKFQDKDIIEFRQWVTRQIKYPAEAFAEGVEGIVVISFVIDKEGTLKNIKTEKSPDQRLTDEVVGVIEKSPKWTPGKQKGKPVSVKFTIPIQFKIPK